MRLLLVSANRERSPYPVFPLGLAYLCDPLRSAGHELFVLDLCFEEDPVAAAAARVAEIGPDAVLISIRNMDNVTWPGSRFYLDGVREVVSAVKGAAPVIVGGSGFSLMPLQALEYLGADYGVVGEGEEVLPRLLERIARGQASEDLPGVLRAGASVFLPPLPVERIGTPDRSLFQVERYHREGGMANVLTKRGCPFSCIYCIYPLLEGCRMRLRPVPEIIDEIRRLVEDHGINYLYFVDDIFNYPPEEAERLCRAMAAEGLPVKWSAFVNPGFFSRRLLDAMLAAGCDGIEFGTDSGSPEMLRSLGKSFAVEDIREASAICRETGVDFAHYLLFGGPGETEETIRESFALMDEVAPTAVIGMTGIRVFPGTELHQVSVGEGGPSSPEEMLRPVFYLASGIEKNLCDIVTGLAMERKNWVVPGLDINMSDRMLEAIRHMPVQGPLWKLMKHLNRTRIRPHMQQAGKQS
ncbi:MAG TPA: lipid biosynthesis B12-binding/radical SAM protein [Verrucomicrobiae bacterium]|nr:lipid biosynthesis B12-binding/radical SAM protein [Verrucomicrobiae bacterium]